MAQRAVVKSLPEDPNLTITLTVGGKQRNLDRAKTELLEKPLLRLQKSAAPPPEKKKKKQKRNPNTTVASAVSAPPLAAPLFIALYDGPTAEHPLIDPESTANEEAWRHGRLLCIGDIDYLIDVNPPLIERVETHGIPFVGIPVVAVPTLLFAQPEQCRWQWWRGRRQQQRHDGTTTTTTAAATTASGGGGWEKIEGAQSQGYTPIAEDIGCMLRVTCSPTRQSSNSSSSGETIEREINTTTTTADVRGTTGVTELDHSSSASTETGPVCLPPHPSSTSGRIEQLPARPRPLSSPSFRVVTYNILADQYASTESAKTELFVSCPSECLQPGYRRPLVLQELLQYNADVICLQEVDQKMFSLCLEPALKLAGFRGIYTNKAGKVREGAATFWRENRFELVEKRDVVLKNCFPLSSSDCDIEAAKYGPAFAPMLRSSPALCTALQRVGTIAQLVLLKPIIINNNDGDGANSVVRPLCVANTHLFFHYAAPHIRTMHTWAILQEAGQLVASQTARRPAFIFCGDLNSDLNDGIPGAIQLLSQGKLPANYWDWAFGVNFKWEKEEEVVESESEETGAAVAAATNSVKSHKKQKSLDDDGRVGVGEGGEVFKMLHTEVEGFKPSSSSTEGGPSAQHRVPGIDLTAPFSLAAADRLRSNVTNYVDGYSGLLDYVWYEEGVLEIENVLPVPPSTALGGFIPNRRFPSDHLAVVADLKFIGDCGDDDDTNSMNKRNNNSSSSSSSSFGDDVSGPGCVVPAGLYNVGVAADVVHRGGLIAVPTDTLYGLAACANNEAAVDRIYAVKARAAHKPVAICVADYEDVGRYAERDHLPEGLLEELLPGPMTVMLVRKSAAPLAAALNPGVSTLGIRIPESDFIRAVCRQYKGALALTSANLSGAESSLSVEEFEKLWGSCDAVFDGGSISGKREGSTIVDLSECGVFRIVREGVGLAAAMAVLERKYNLKKVS